MNILSRLQEHLNFCQDRIPGKVVGIFFFGSENYNLHTPESDVDAKMLFIPEARESLTVPEELIHNGKELISVVDIRYMLCHLCDGDLHLLEILYSKYYIILPEFQNFWEKLRSLRAEIAKSNIEGLFSYLGQRAAWVVRNMTSQLGEKIYRKNPITGITEIFWAKSAFRMFQLEQVAVNIVNNNWENLLTCERNEQALRAKIGDIGRTECEELLKKYHKNLFIIITQYRMLHNIEVNEQTIFKILPIIDNFLLQYYSREEISAYMETESKKLLTEII